MPLNVFGIPLGSDPATTFVSGFADFCADLSDIEIARTEVFVNTSRMQKKVRAAFDAGPPTLVPKIRLITDIAARDPTLLAAPPVSALQERLEISRLVSALLDSLPDLAPRSSLYPLCDSLQRLLEEMVEEDVRFASLTNMDVTDQSGHWERSLKFLEIIGSFAGKSTSSAVAQKRAVDHLIDQWTSAPPDHPVVVLGSTGSRKTTRTLMKAVARLPKGAVLLPGFDWSMPMDIWPELGDPNARESDRHEDHPQYRYWQFVSEMGATPSDVKPWPNGANKDQSLNKVVSLSLRPAPVTDAWLREGPELEDLVAATDHVSLIEAKDQKVEAETIAIRMRHALQEEKTVALISPDRVLTRQVAAALDRWDLIADDSAGVPLTLTPPGRLLCHILDLLTGESTAEALLTLLKHPIVHTGRSDRGDHLLRTRELELWLRRSGKVTIDRKALQEFAASRKKADPEIEVWTDWIFALIFDRSDVHEARLQDWLTTHLNMARNLSSGPSPSDEGELFQEAAGRAVEAAVEHLNQCSEASVPIPNRDYFSIFRGFLASETVRNQNSGRADLLILGTLESRVEQTDLVILGGLNDGIWPPAPSPDPWLNRKMRKDLGLLSPDRQIGLSAHDYQQAMAGSEICVSRSLRSADSDTVPSRWLNRLTNLLDGLPDNGGPIALSKMRSRGAMWLDAAKAQLSVVDREAAAKRPSPQPPTNHRPKQLSVTKIKSLIRDPYAIYAESLLRLRPLNALSQRQEFQLRGVVFHKILQEFIDQKLSPDDNAALLEISRRILNEDCPWPNVRLQWLARLEKLTPTFLSQEQQRQEGVHEMHTEKKGFLRPEASDFTLVGVADRIDQMADGTSVIYDYKTGVVPTKKQQLYFDKQLLLEAAIQEQGGFNGVAPSTVKSAMFLGVGSKLTSVDAPLDEVTTAQVWGDLLSLIENWKDPNRGYSARLALFSKDDFGPYDHLSRFGEWGLSDPVHPERVK